MSLDAADLADLTALRRHLHRRPELSGAEPETAAAIVAALGPAGPDEIVTGLGGHGVAAVFAGAAPGPTVLVRAELDGLPIPETGTVAHRSEIAGRGHLCGHDGHMTILVGLSRLFARRRPARGRAVLLFQPAEEDGSGAAAVIADPRFATVAPDLALSLHNLPGLPLGAAALAEGPVNCASRGLRAVFEGRTSHAAEPEAGRSPAVALAHLIERLPALARGGPLDCAYRLLTLTHAVLGEQSFGISPGRAELWMTLRTLLDDEMDALLAEVEGVIAEEAAAADLGLAFTHHDVFAACVNHPEATAVLAAALEAEAIPRVSGGVPMKASEDFGRFGHTAKAAMVFLGAGETCPRLHNPDYDFPDALIATGARLFDRAVRSVLG